ncbi:hypothetical protein HL658_19840 [Azospirillum sp. RWY-5-1]|uniref:Uncharacterized protein n=1 Tax=Azospirillum oleiclasticum TaxID=2735135 RepID=A0ABX2TDG8_9PROT|nr:hypothetical protein [Azospirillum oleiclasticum]NYZ14805.1 hypothetical protein [Azospirillum oleiclasticum]NYZ22209.1 hypothetical protein [Azospirillum oleiclasticum]
MHKNPLVDFLRHYGPIPAQDNMYDERIHEARERAGVAPIEAPPMRLGDVLGDLRAGGPRVVILTGTAGDGKTFHCRRAFEELGGDAVEWAKGLKLVAVPLGDGRSAVIAKDLSEFTATEKEALLPRLAAAANGHGTDAFLLAANDGQLVASFRGWAAADQARQPLFREIEAMLVEGRQKSDRWRLSMYNLSREMHGALFDTLAGLIVNHPDWKHCCGCPAKDRCPILVNRDRLADGSLFRERLAQVIDLAGANDHHLPIRHLLMLVVNILLGVAGDGKSPLLNCKRSQRIEPKEATSPYSNALGLNVPERVRFQYQAFAAIDAFGIGKETSNVIDDLLVYGHIERKEDYAKAVSADPLFGEAAHRHSRAAYLAGDRSGTPDFLKSLEAQRQRLFFTLGADLGGLDPWHLTVFRHAGEYLEFCASLREGRPPDKWTPRLVRGLNRTFTGMMLDVHADVLLCSAGGDGRSRVARFLSHTLSVSRQRRAPYLSFDWAVGKATPRMVVIDPMARPGEPSPGEIPLRLTHFEYLMRVSSGSLPASFSRQCFEDFHDFKLKVIDRLDALFKDADDGFIRLEAVEAEASGAARTKEFSFRVPTDD